MDNGLINKLKSDCEEAAGLTESWMLDNIKREDICSKEHKDPVCYYKWPLTLFIRRREKEANKLFHWICKKSLTPSGDFMSNRSGFHLEFHN